MSVVASAHLTAPGGVPTPSWRVAPCALGRLDSRSQTGRWPPPRAVPSAPMEKFVIKGGPAALRRDHRGRQQERRPADPRRLPAHRRGGACSPTCRGSATPRPRSPLLEQLGVRVEWVADNSCALRADGVTETGRRRGPLGARSAPRSCSPGPLLARFGEARMPPPGGDFIGRRRLDPHLDAFKDLGARIDGDRGDRDRRPRGRAEAVRDLHGRALGDGDRERADGRGADPGADDDRQRRLRAARPGPRPAAGQDGRRRSTGSAPT